MEPTVPLQEWIETYLGHHEALNHSPKTITHYQNTFKLFCRYLDECGMPADSRCLTTSTMHHFARWLRDTPIKERRGRTERTPVGVFGILKDLRAFTRWLHAEQLLERPVNIPMPRLPQTLFPILSDTELEHIWTSRYLNGRSPLATRNRALLGLMLDTGLRRAEVASLMLSSIDLHDCLLTVMGKGSKQRRVPFSSGVKQLLESWLTIRGDEPGSLFWLKAAGIRMVFRRIEEELELPAFHPHLLRHQAATMLVRNNADLESVRRILGHADLATTAKYLSMSDEDLRTKHAAASPYESLMRKANQSPVTRRKRLSLKE